MKRILQVFVGLLAMMAFSAQAEGDAAAGQSKAAICAACHAVDGNSVVAQWPKLAGQHEAYLARHIILIRDGLRPVPEMAGIAAGLSDEDAADLGAYFAGQATSPGVANTSLAAAGERLYRAGNSDSGVPACMACHGPAGEGNPLAGYPALAGQHSAYTAKMLNGYRDGSTWGPDDAASIVMTGVANELTDEEIAAVSSYIEGLYQAQP